MNKSLKKNVAYCIMTALLIISVIAVDSAILVSANMAQPMEDRGSGILFDRHESVRVDSQTLDINFIGDTNAAIIAVYTMTNTSSEPVTVRSMFLSPIYDRRLDRNYQITSDGIALKITSEFFAFGYDFLTQDDLLNWEEVLASAEPPKEAQEWDWDWPFISAVSFEIEFDAGQTVDVSVSYIYSIGVNRTHSERIGNRSTLRYFLTPARFWKDYGDLTINLTLHENQPALIRSSLNFTRQSRGVYIYQSDGVPESELFIVVGSLPFGIIRSGHGELFMISAIIFAITLFALIFAFVVTKIKGKKSRFFLIRRTLTTIFCLSYIGVFLMLPVSSFLFSFLLIASFYRRFYDFFLIFIILSICAHVFSIISVIIATNETKNESKKFENPV